MPSNGVYVLYPLDTTGVNLANKVQDEPHTLSNNLKRIIVPTHGPFYVESLRIFDGVSLTEVLDPAFKIPGINQEATLELGKAVADAIIIEDVTVASSVTITYQAVGGLYQRDMSNVVNMFEAVINDSRAVDWQNVFNKPPSFPTGFHPHHLADIFGWGAVTSVLERLVQAVALHQVPAFEMIFDAIKDNSVTEADIDQGRQNDKFLTLNTLQYAAKRLNFNSMSIDPMTRTLSNGKSMSVDVKMTVPLEADLLYWKIEHTETDASLFLLNNGTVSLYRGAGSVLIQSIRRNNIIDVDRKFRLVFYRGGLNRVELGRSLDYTLNGVNNKGKALLDVYRINDLGSPRLGKTPLTRKAFKEVWGTPRT